MKGKWNEVRKSAVQKRKEKIKGKGQPKKTPFLFVIWHNCKGKGHTMNSCISASRAVYKKIERKAEMVEKGKKRVKIIDKDGFTKVVNMQRTPSSTPGPAPESPAPEPRIVELKSDWDDLGEKKTKKLIKKAEQDGWKMKGPLTGPSRY